MEKGKVTLNRAAYEELVGVVRKMLAETEKVGRQADSSLARVYWEIGDKIVKAGLTGREYYGAAIIEKMAEDLEVNPRTLRQAVLFRRVYDRQILNRTVQHLTWSHYRQLIEVREEAARRYYEGRAVEEGWSGERLHGAMVGKEYEREVKKEEGAGVLKRPTGAEFVFGAEVMWVVDGDTLVLNIDTGFKNRRYGERIRLAKLNAPEVETKKGKEVRDYVRERLMQARGVVVKTEKSDVHGRYVGHVFYSFEEERPGRVYEEGAYLNDELIKKGMAERM